MPFQREQFHRFRGRLVVEVVRSRICIRVARDAPSTFRPRSVAGKQPSVEVIGVMSLAAVRSRFRLEPSALVVIVLRGLSLRAFIAFHPGEQQVAHIRGLVDFAHACRHHSIFGGFRHQLPHRVRRFQLRARADSRDGIFPRASPHVPRPAVVPPRDGVGLPGRRLFRDGEFSLSIQGKNKRFKGSSRHRIKSLFVRSADLPRRVERDGVTNGRYGFHVEQPVPQVPDLSERAVPGMLDVQVSGGVGNDLLVCRGVGEKLARFR